MPKSTLQSRWAYAWWSICFTVANKASTQHLDMHSYIRRRLTGTSSWNFKLKKGNPRTPWRFVIWHNRWPILLIRVNFNSHPYIMDASPRPLSDELPPAPLAQKYLGSPTDFLKGVVGKRVIVRLTSGVDYQGPTFFLQFIHGDLFFFFY